jgi:hypothetical protein
MFLALDSGDTVIRHRQWLVLPMPSSVIDRVNFIGQRDDWEKSCHLMEYLRGDCERPLILSGDNEGVLMWHVDASFAVHPNMRGHTGGCMTIARGFPFSVPQLSRSSRQRVPQRVS